MATPILFRNYFNRIPVTAFLNSELSTRNVNFAHITYTSNDGLLLFELTAFVSECLMLRFSPRAYTKRPLALQWHVLLPITDPNLKERKDIFKNLFFFQLHFSNWMTLYIGRDEGSESKLCNKTNNVFSSKYWSRSRRFLRLLFDSFNFVILWLATNMQLYSTATQYTYQVLPEWLAIYSQNFWSLKWLKYL